MQKTIARMTGYKATDRNMCCNGYRFEIGKWSEPVTGELEECRNGYHFCENVSGVWAYYPLPCAGTRVFKVEAEEVLVADPEPGADVKRVCRRLRLVEEISGFDDSGNTGEGNTGSGNTGDRNTGSGNTGNWNSGNRNTGRRNTGYCNTGSYNTGLLNTGDGNTGEWNTGDWNTGDTNVGTGNTGDCNTGDRNTGNWNSGFWNTGHRNTGDCNTGSCNTGSGNTGSGNACSNSSGFCCIKEPEAVFFDEPTGMTVEQFRSGFGDELNCLCRELLEPEAPDFAPYAHMPNITPEKLKKLWEAHRALRSGSV